MSKSADALALIKKAAALLESEIDSEVVTPDPVFYGALIDRPVDVARSFKASSKSDKVKAGMLRVKMVAIAPVTVIMERDDEPYLIQTITPVDDVVFAELYFTGVHEVSVEVVGDGVLHTLEILDMWVHKPVSPAINLQKEILDNEDFQKLLTITAEPPYAATDFYDSIYLFDCLANAFFVTRNPAFLETAYAHAARQLARAETVTTVDLEKVSEDDVRPQRSLGATQGMYLGWVKPKFLDELQWAIGIAKCCWMGLKYTQRETREQAENVFKLVSLHFGEKHYTSPGIQHRYIGKLVDSAVDRTKLANYRASGYWNDKITLTITFLAFVEACYACLPAEGLPVYVKQLPWREWVASWLEEYLVIDGKNGTAHWDEGNPNIANGGPGEHKAYDTGHARREPLMVFHLLWLCTDDDSLEAELRGAYRALSKTMSELILHEKPKIAGEVVEGIHARNYIDGNDGPFRGIRDARGNTEGMAGFIYGGWEYPTGAHGDASKGKLWEFLKQVQDGSGRPGHVMYSGSQARNSSTYAKTSLQAALLVTDKVKF